MAKEAEMWDKGPATPEARMTIAVNSKEVDDGEKSVAEVRIISLICFEFLFCKD